MHVKGLEREEESRTVVMEFGICYRVFNDSPAESTATENGWQLNITLLI